MAHSEQKALFLVEKNRKVLENLKKTQELKRQADLSMITNGDYSFEQDQSTSPNLENYQSEICNN